MEYLRRYHIQGTNQTTQLNKQGADNDLSRHFSTNDRMLRYCRIDSQFFTDTFFVTARGKSSSGHTCMQIYVSDCGFVALYPMTSKGEFINTLRMFCKENGVSFGLVVEPLGGADFKRSQEILSSSGYKSPDPRGVHPVGKSC